MVLRVVDPAKLRKSKLSPVAAPNERISLDERIFTIIRQIEAEANLLEDKQIRELWLDALQTFAKTGNIEALVKVCEWRRKVVPMDEFLFSEAYMALAEDEVYPSVVEACHELDTDKYTDAVLTGGLGTGKTTIGNLMVARGIHKISCMRHPQTTFGVISKSSLVFVIQSVRLSTAKKAVFQEFGTYLNKSPYFRTVYPYDYKVTSQMIFREQNVSVLPVTSSPTGGISMNVVGAVLDEANFMQKIEKSKSAYADDETAGFDQAKVLYEAMSRRRRSRFNMRGKLPGIMFVISSTRFHDDFTEKKAAESAMRGGPNPLIYVYHRAQWTAKPRSQFMEEEFRVQVGNQFVRTKLLAEGEDCHPDCREISVPMDLYEEFRRDPDGSLRDYAGITTIATKPFISQREYILKAVSNGHEHGYVNPLELEEVDLSLGNPAIIGDRLRNDVKMFRACHVDLSLKKDGCGLAVGHIAGTRIVERYDIETGKKTFDVLPVIAIDLVVRIVPPKNGEIVFEHVRRFIRHLRDRWKLDIKYVTFDGWQSIDSRQILRTQGFQTDYWSVDDLEPYRSLRDTLYEERLLMPKHDRCMKEMAELEQVFTTGGKEKVDHRPNGTKDVSDAVCGVTSFLLQRRAAWSALEVDGRVGMHLLGNKAKADIAKESTQADSEYEGGSTRRRTTGRRKSTAGRRPTSGRGERKEKQTVAVEKKPQRDMKKFFRSEDEA